jgi:hypothetical protein
VVHSELENSGATRLSVWVVWLDLWNFVTIPLSRVVDGTPVPSDPRAQGGCVCDCLLYRQYARVSPVAFYD